MNNITMKLNADDLILSALKEDITSEDISTNSVMRHYQLGEVDLICKEDGVIAGLEVFKRVFELLDADTKVEFTVKDGDKVIAAYDTRMLDVEKIECVETIFDTKAVEIFVNHGEVTIAQWLI